MKLKNKSILCIILLFIVCIVFVSVGNVAANDTVNVTTFKEMEYQLGIGNNVNLMNNLTGLEGITEGIGISKSVTVNGNGHTIDAQKEGRFFFINQYGHLTLKNLTLKNGYVVDKFGGAILCGGGLNVEDCTFDHNRVDVSGKTLRLDVCGGGAIAVKYTNNDDTYNGKLTCINSKFEYNFAPNGGAIYTLNDLYVYHCYFEQNGAGIARLSYLSGLFEGGAIACRDSLTCIKCHFFRNYLMTPQESSSRGGAIAIEDDGVQTHLIQDCYFGDNNCDMDDSLGAAIYSAGSFSKLNLTHNIWDKNNINGHCDYPSCNVYNCGSYDTIINSFFAKYSYEYFVEHKLSGDVLHSDSHAFHDLDEYLNYGLHINVTAFFNNDTIGGNIMIKIKENCTGIITINFNGTNYTKELINNSAVFTNLTISGNTLFNIFFHYKQIDRKFENLYAYKLKKYDINVTGELYNTNPGGLFNISLPIDAKGNIELIINGTSYKTTVINGKAVINNITGLIVGNNHCTIDYKDDNKYENSRRNMVINISKVNDYIVNVTGELYNTGPGGLFNISLPIDANGNITIIINNTNYNATIINGKAIINNITDLIAGNNNIIVIYKNDVKYNDTNRNIIINISKVVNYNINITAKLNITGKGGLLNISLPVDANGNITIMINDNFYNSIIYNGVVVNGLSNVFVNELIEGNNKIIVKYFNDIKYNETIRNITFNVESVSFIDLQELINLKSNINLESNYIYKMNNDKGSLIINKTISINGNGYYIDGKNLVNIFLIKNNGNLTLMNIKLNNALMDCIINNGILSVNNVTSKAPIKNNGIIISSVTFLVIDSNITTYDSFTIVLKTNDGIVIKTNNLIFKDDQKHTYKDYIYYNGIYVCYTPVGVTGHVTFNNVSLNNYPSLTSSGSLNINKNPKKVESNKFVLTKIVKNFVVKTFKTLVKKNLLLSTTFFHPF